MPVICATSRTLMPLLQRVADVLQPLGMRRDQPLGQDARLDFVAAGALAGFQRAHALQQRFLEGAADGHHLAHRLHLRAQRFVGAGKLFELPLGNLHHHVIERGLEAGGRLAGDVVGDLVEGVADGQLGGDLGDGKAGGLGGQRRGARDARVHLDDHHAPGAADARRTGCWSRRSRRRSRG